jgi:transposase-like protein
MHSALKKRPAPPAPRSRRERRRRWNYDDKVRLVEETLQAGEAVSGVARRHEVAASLLFTWQRSLTSLAA